MTEAPFAFDISPFLCQDESQHYERKSLFEGQPGRKLPRDRRTVRDDVAKNVAAFANAEGGVLILGVEDDGELTGHNYPPSVVQGILEAPKYRLSPPQAPGFIVKHDGVELLVFEVAVADTAVQIQGGGFPMRVGDQTTQIPESSIQALKLAGLVESWESRPSPLGPTDLDSDLLRQAREGGGLGSHTDAEYLLRRKLADIRGRTLQLRRAAELLFARHGPDHPNAGVRIFRVVGTQRRVGLEHNVEERPRIEGPLPSVIEETFRTIAGLLRRPSRLVGERFRETPEYPDFSWKEAVLNAIAHRDYGIEGRCAEVWLYDDRMEVISPGGLVIGVDVERLRALERVHASRNPRLVRGLVDLGYMRDQGEGIPRIFAEMETSFLPEPELEAGANDFTLTLRNTPTLNVKDRSFVASLASEQLTDQEFRALLEVHRHGRVDNARMRTVAGLDTLKASILLRRLRDRGLLKLRGAGSASYYVLGAAISSGVELGADRQELGADGQELGTDGQELGADRQELDAWAAASEQQNLLFPPATLIAAIEELGKRPRKERLRRVIRDLCEWRTLSGAELAQLLGMSLPNLTRRHLTPMVEAGELVRIYEELNHPRQAYRAAGHENERGDEQR